MRHEKIIKENKYVVVVFHADWCQPCKIMAPVLRKVEAAFPKVVFLHIDVDTETEIAEALAVESVPTSVMFRDGVEVGWAVGAISSPRFGKIFLDTLGVKPG